MTLNPFILYKKWKAQKKAQLLRKQQLTKDFYLDLYIICYKNVVYLDSLIRVHAALKQDIDKRRKSILQRKEEFIDKIKSQLTEEKALKNHYKNLAKI